jgi:molecular chaperone GrpE
MTENENDENHSIIPDVNIKKSPSIRKFQKNMEQNDNCFDIKDITKEEMRRSADDQQKIDELNNLLEKEKQKSLRLLADYQNLEKQTVDRINAREDKIILNFLTVYEDFVRAKNIYEKEGGNVDNLNSIIKNMESILEHYEVKPIEAEGRKFNPKFHEVVQEIEDNDHEEGTIVKEITKGYIIRNEIMKYSKVCVSKKIIKE